MARDLIVRVVGDATSLERAFKKSSKSANTFGRSMTKSSSTTQRAFGGMTRGAFGLAGAFIGPVGLVVAAKAAFGEFAQGQKVMAQTNAVIKSTGKQANVSAKHVEALANAMLRKTGIDDEATQAAENWLLSFRNVRNELGKDNKIFDRATRATADLATAQADGAVPSTEQMVSASKLLGKALDDPERGLTALRRAGIGFTKQQKEQIKVALEHNNALKAQDIILDEVTKQTGGRAVAAGKTFAGQWAIVRETVLNLSAVLVEKLMPSIQRVLQQLVKWLNNSKNQKQVLDTVKQAASAVAAVAGGLASAFKALTRITGSTKNTLKLLFGALVAIKTLQMISAFANIVGGIASIGRQARIANTQLAGLRLSLIALRAIGPIAIVVTLVLEKQRIESWLKKHHLGWSTKSLPELAGDLGEQGQRLGKAFRGRVGLGPAPRMVPVLAMPAGARGPAVINIEHFHSSAPNAKKLENELMKRSKQRAHPRRSTR